jgi:hypothetical protein
MESFSRGAFFNSAQPIPSLWVAIINRQETVPRFRQIQTTEVMIPVKKTFLAGLLALCLTPAIAMAQIVVRIAPPAPIVEVHDHPPHEGWVWIDGYHRWDGHRYIWVHGRWARPPHEHAVWVAHHWERRGDGWVLIEGHWQ